MDEPLGETSSLRRSWLSGVAAASHTGRSGYCLVWVDVSDRWLVGWLELAEEQKGLKRDTHASVHLCLPACVCVCFTSGTLPNLTIVPLQPVVFVNKAPGLTVAIRVPTHKNQYIYLCNRHAHVQYFPVMAFHLQ